MDKSAPSTGCKALWPLAFCLFWSCPTFPASAEAAVSLTKAEALRIGRKIWQNECGGSISGLTSWNEGEDFASLGIGHFIWYPEGRRGPFEESFPKLIEFISADRADIPGWLQRSTFCPWNSRAEFFRAENSRQMIELREFLIRTIGLQAEYMVARLQSSLTKMLDQAEPGDRDKVRQQFARVASTAQGCYALVDYVNFKGEGTLQTERYRDQGWGLLQVLQEMRGTSEGRTAVAEFSRAATVVLQRRVRNSPSQRKEARWLPGWLNRVNTYRQGS
jgi:hypothetical protein